MSTFIMKLIQRFKYCIMEEYVKITLDNYNELQELLREQTDRISDVTEILKRTKIHKTVVTKEVETEREFINDICIQDDTLFRYHVYTDDEAVAELTERIKSLEYEINRLRKQ